MDGWIKTALINLSCSQIFSTIVKSNKDAWISENIRVTIQTNRLSHIHQHNMYCIMTAVRKLHQWILTKICFLSKATRERNWVRDGKERLGLHALFVCDSQSYLKKYCSWKCQLQENKVFFKLVFSIQQQFWGSTLIELHKVLIMGHIWLLFFSLFGQNELLLYEIVLLKHSP